ncbi:putative disease resistance protein [Camellia lanceoleosa]|uniref:Disease resistance protein n=1 Tax=Camellia lanceoleosa TaxID=1840588 RepID=A0ACC0HBI9_9ERIC|nr:putative disease resistance protein [Camellia lanceoleosa]
MQLEMTTATEKFGKRSIADTVFKILGSSVPGRATNFKKILGTVIYVSFSRYRWSRRTIQNEITRHLSLQHENFETDDEIAQKLLEVLKSRKFLLLLDDVWKRIDLDVIGVPCKDLRNGSKIVLAARHIDVCHAMSVDKVLKMEVFSPEEAWTLFCDQVKHWIEEGLIAGHLVDANEKGLGIVKDHVDAFLLESSDDGVFVQMHRVIRDLALWIISTKPEHCQFLSKIGPRKEELLKQRGMVLSRAFAGLKKPPPEREWKEIEMMFLMGIKFTRVPWKLSCPQLVMLSLQSNINLTTIPKFFFDGMPSLQVLNLSNTGIKSLPTTLFRLCKLQALILRDCLNLVEIPPQIGDLEHLEVLDLQGTEINRLPNEVGNLSLLKLLRVSFYGLIDCCEQVEKLPPSLLSHESMSRLAALKELSIIVGS